jgi:hypothetical protein
MVKAGGSHPGEPGGGLGLTYLEVRVGTGYADTRNRLWVKPDPGYGVIAGRVVDARGYLVPQQPVLLYRGAQPDRYWRQTFTYPDGEVRPDPAWGETFAFSDVPVGSYLVKTYFDGRLVTRPITVTEQATSFVLIEGPPPPSAQPPVGHRCPRRSTR